jgi:plasmid stabilization system protein ParE
MRVVIQPEASTELEDAFRWYENKAEDLGHDFLEEIDRGIAAIRRMPTVWPLYQKDLGVRRFLVHRFPFGILYRVISDEIQVIAIMHLRRKPGYWTGRARR